MKTMHGMVFFSLTYFLSCVKNSLYFQSLFLVYLQANVSQGQQEDAYHEHQLAWAGERQGQQPDPNDQYITLEDGTFSCCTCYKQFKGHYTIMRHILIHTGEKPYSCFHCDYRAVQKVQLLGHCMRRHSMSKEHFKALLKARENRS